MWTCGPRVVSRVNLGRDEPWRVKRSMYFDTNRDGTQDPWRVPKESQRQNIKKRKHPYGRRVFPDCVTDTHRRARIFPPFCFRFTLRGFLVVSPPLYVPHTVGREVWRRAPLPRSTLIVMELCHPPIFHIWVLYTFSLPLSLSLS